VGLEEHEAQPGLFSVRRAPSGPHAQATDTHPPARTFVFGSCFFMMVVGAVFSLVFDLLVCCFAGLPPYPPPAPPPRARDRLCQLVFVVWFVVDPGTWQPPPPPHPSTDTKHGTGPRPHPTPPPHPTSLANKQTPQSPATAPHCQATQV